MLWINLSNLLFNRLLLFVDNRLSLFCRLNRITTYSASDYLSIEGLIEASGHLCASPIYIVASAHLATLIVDVKAEIRVQNININRPLEGLVSIDHLRDRAGSLL